MFVKGFAGRKGALFARKQLVPVESRGPFPARKWCDTMKPTLLLFAHPALERSVANAAMLEAVRDLEHVTVHDLYEAYPDFLIDVPREQELVEANERIVIQHPFFWYSTPAIVKEWFDLVLEFGWAYGEGGDRLHGKSVLSAITTGGSKEAYCAEGHNQ